MIGSAPPVSILINNYNYGRFLVDAIDSALHQTYTKTEVIVVDDGSTDNSRDVIASYGSRIVSVFKANGGQASAFNAGFAASRGNWILLLDSDDVFLPHKVQEVMRLAEQNPDVALIAHNVEYCGTDGTPISFLPFSIQERRIHDDRKRIVRGQVTSFLPATSALAFRRDILTAILPMPEEIRITADDYLKRAALLYAPVLLTPEALARQRIHGSNAYTGTYARDAGEAGEIGRAIVAAQVGFHLKNRYPMLRRVVCKQYGRILCQLALARSDKARTVMAEIRSRYSVMDLSPVCLFYVAGAFTKALVKNFFLVCFV